MARSITRKTGIHFNEHIEGEGAQIFAHPASSGRGHRLHRPSASARGFGETIKRVSIRELLVPYCYNDSLAWRLVHSMRLLLDDAEERLLLGVLELEVGAVGAWAFGLVP